MRKADLTTFKCRLSRNSGSLNRLDVQESVQASNGIAFTHFPPAFRSSIASWTDTVATWTWRDGARWHWGPRVLQGQPPDPTASTQLIQPFQLLDKMCLQFAWPHRNAAHRTTGRIGLELLLAWKQNMFKSTAEDVPLMSDSLRSISYSLCTKIIPEDHTRRTTRLTSSCRNAKKIITVFSPSKPQSLSRTKVTSDEKHR